MGKSNNKNEINQYDSHSWTVAKINNKWIPFDATLGLYYGRLPISHIFERFGNEGMIVATTDDIYIEDTIMTVKYIQL